ncbi:MAG: hypothetical protein QNJ91_06050 [Gammaproteobacteria bacterium]|nr:hypothetical protein [Gammaproteobacteria bacterium]
MRSGNGAAGAMTRIRGRRFDRPPTGPAAGRRPRSSGGLALLALGAVLLAGCAGLGDGLQPAEPLAEPPASAAEALAVARDKAKGGHWVEARRYLASASLTVDDAAAMAAAQATLEAEWEREERALEDRILVGDAENLKRKVGLLEQLSNAQPDDLVLTSRRLYWKEALGGKTQALLGCAEVHVADRPQLAKRCFEIVAWLPAEPAIEQRLAVVDAQLRTIASANAERRKERAERERQARAKVLLKDAKTAIEAHDYRTALDMLDEVGRLQPNNAEVAGLREEALSMLSPRIEALVKLGDHLYLDEQLEAAVATWQAALTLKPGDEGIVARIDRAKNVLEKLARLREQQRDTRRPAP